MTHEETIGRLPSFVEGRLAEAEHTQVDRHVAGCEDCRSLAEGYRVIARALREEASSRTGEHPSSEALVAFALSASGLDPAERLQVERHLEGCAACFADVEATRAAERLAESHVTERVAPRARAGVPRWLAAAAMVAGVLLGYPIYRATLGPAAPAGGIESASGAQALTVVSGATRGDGGDAPVVEVLPGQPFVAFALALPADIDVPASGTLALDLHADSGGSVWRREIASARLTALAGSTGAVLVVVPSSAVEPGRYVLSLSSAKTDGAPPLLLAPLRIARSHDQRQSP